jgi:hypothetical protein
MADICQWCGKSFFAYQRIDGAWLIPVHRNPGDKYECLGSNCPPKDNQVATAITPKKSVYSSGSPG